MSQEKRRSECFVSSDCEIPQVGLGQFVQGYQMEPCKLRKKYLWFLLIPFVGWIAVLVVLPLVYLLFRRFGSHWIIFIYENGVCYQRHDNVGESYKSTLINFNDLSEVQLSTRRNCSTLTGSFLIDLFTRGYYDTTVTIKYLDKNGRDVFHIATDCDNYKDDKDHYDAIAYASFDIHDLWIEFSKKRLSGE